MKYLTKWQEQQKSQTYGTANIFLKCPFWKLHNLKPRLSSAQLRVRNARNAFSFLSEMVHISRLWFSWHGEDKIKSLDVKTTQKWLLAVHTIQKSHNMIRAIYVPELWIWNCSSSYANQNKNNFMFANLAKHVNNQTNCHSAVEIFKKIWICLVYIFSCNTLKVKGTQTCQ